MSKKAALGLVALVLAWGIAVQAEPVKTQPSAESGNLKIKVGIVMQSGDVKPLAKRGFYLLPDSFLNEKAKYIDTNTILANGQPSTAEINQEYAINQQLAQKYKVENLGYCLTNFEGECEFENVKYGHYFVSPLENLEIGSSSVFWDTPISLDSTHNYYELSNDNMTDYEPLHTALKESIKASEAKIRMLQQRLQYSY